LINESIIVYCRIDSYSYGYYIACQNNIFLISKVCTEIFVGSNIFIQTTKGNNKTSAKKWQNNKHKNRYLLSDVYVNK